MKLFTTEAVTKFHPDKYADQISDAIVTACMREDRNSRCGVEALVKGTTVVLAGEVKTKTCFVIEPRTKAEQVIRAFGIARVLHEGFVKPREIAVAIHHDLPFILSRTRE